MGRVLEILKTNNKKADDQRKQKPYLLRYKKPEFEVVDHYRHLCQLNRIYWMLEQKLQQANYGEFNDAFPELLNQYTKIGHDISFLDNKRNAQVKKQYQYGEATVAYVMYLRSLDMNKPKDVKILFAHFLVRILSDLFDDQEMKANLNRLFFNFPFYRPAPLSYHCQ